MDKLIELRTGDLVLLHEENHGPLIVRVVEIGNDLFSHKYNGVPTAAKISDIVENVTGDCRQSVMEMNVEKLTLI